MTDKVIYTCSLLDEQNEKDYRKSYIIKFMYKITRKLSVLTIFAIEFNYNFEEIKISFLSHSVIMLHVSES